MLRIAAKVILKKDAEKAISDQAQWHTDECRGSQEGNLPYPGW